MSIRKIILLCVFLAVNPVIQAAFAEKAVIVHPSNTSTLDKGVISKIFLGKLKSFPAGGTAIPINLKENNDTRQKFDSEVLGKSSSQIKSYWAKLMFTGKATPPKEAETTAEAKELVARNVDLISYIDASEVDDSVKVILTF